MNINQLIPSMSSMPYLVRDIVGKVTNAVMNYTDAEIEVIEATNDDSWGPHGKLMEHIAELTFSPSTYNEVMSMLWKRILQDGRTNWRRVYKGCTLLIYLLKHGSHKVLHSAQDRLEELKMLEHIEYPIEGSRNTTKNVQLKLAELLKLIEDSDIIENERIKAKELKTKYVGVSSKDYSTGKLSQSFQLEMTPPSMDSHISGRWRSTNPGFLDKITEVTERVKEFVIDSRNSFKSHSDNESSEDECQQRRHSPTHTELEDEPSAINEKTFATANKETDVDEFSEFQQADDFEKDHVYSTLWSQPQTANAQSTNISLIDFDKPEVQSTSCVLDPFEDLFSPPSIEREAINKYTVNNTNDLDDLDFLNTTTVKTTVMNAENSVNEISNDNNIFDECFALPTTTADDLLLHENSVDNLLLSLDDQCHMPPIATKFTDNKIDRNNAHNTSDLLDNEAKLPNTWNDCLLQALKIDLDCLTTNNKEISRRRDNTRTPMAQMKKPKQ